MTARIAKAAVTPRIMRFRSARTISRSSREISSSPLTCTAVGGTTEESACSCSSEDERSEGIYSCQGSDLTAFLPSFHRLKPRVAHSVRRRRLPDLCEASALSTLIVTSVLSSFSRCEAVLLGGGAALAYGQREDDIPAIAEIKPRCRGRGQGSSTAKAARRARP
jgi:hypothetical protein